MRPPARSAKQRHDNSGIPGNRGCAGLGAELAVTYLNDRAKKHVEPLAKALSAPIFMPLDIKTEQVDEKPEWPT
jgi:enoyl-[acyl-carrier-protein] reductase (NADH)